MLNYIRFLSYNFAVDSIKETNHLEISFALARLADSTLSLLPCPGHVWGWHLALPTQPKAGQEVKLESFFIILRFAVRAIKIIDFVTPHKQEKNYMHALILSCSTRQRTRRAVTGECSGHEEVESQHNYCSVVFRPCPDP